MTEIGPRMSTALGAVFLPLARILLNLEITAKPVLNLLEASFVEAARHGLERNGKATSISKIAEATGFTRKKVRQLVGSNDNSNQFVSIYGTDEADGC